MSEPKLWVAIELDGEREAFVWDFYNDKEIQDVRASINWETVLDTGLLVIQRRVFSTRKDWTVQLFIHRSLIDESASSFVRP